MLAELAKYGASLTLATQTLGALVGPSGDRHLLDAVFGNTDHLFAFNCAATDAKVLAPELGGPLEPADLVELGDFLCYARLSHRGERLPAFSLRLDPPPPGDPVVRDALAASSAARYGRAAGVVAADREALLERIAQLGRRASSASTGEAIDDPDNGALPIRHQNRTDGRRRSQNRPSKRSKGTNAGGNAVQLELEGREVSVAIEHESKRVP